MKKTYRLLLWGLSPAMILSFLGILAYLPFILVYLPFGEIFGQVYFLSTIGIVMISPFLLMIWAELFATHVWPDATWKHFIPVWICIVIINVMIIFAGCALLINSFYFGRVT